MNRILVLPAVLMLAGCAGQPSTPVPSDDLALRPAQAFCQPSFAAPAPAAANVDSLEAEIRAALARRNERLAFERGKVNALIACNRPALSRAP